MDSTVDLTKRELKLYERMKLVMSATNVADEHSLSAAVKAARTSIIFPALIALIFIGVPSLLIAVASLYFGETTFLSSAIAASIIYFFVNSIKNTVSFKAVHGVLLTELKSKGGGRSRFDYLT